MLHASNIALNHEQLEILNKDWKGQLKPQILNLYQKIKNNPTLFQQNCHLAVELNRGYEFDSVVVYTGTIDECFQKAFEHLYDYHILYIQLPIGETIYNVAEFVYRGQNVGYIQQTFLNPRILEDALPSVSELIQREIELIESDNFSKEDILNSLLILSETSYTKRFYDDDTEYSLFEDIAVEINISGSIMDAMRENYGEKIDVSTPYKLARFKAFTRMMMWEYEEKEQTRRMSRV